MNHQEKHSNNNGRADYSIKSLREQMAELLALREQVREAEPDATGDSRLSREIINQDQIPCNPYTQ
jgi:hypothetical protein